MMATMRRLLSVLIFSAASFAQSGALGIFTNSGDIGHPAIKGSAEFNPANSQYRITGSGANIWGKQDQFQYLWREITGNFTVTATIRFLGQGNQHRKAGIMVRQSLDDDATYADVVFHGNGMPGLQWRSKKGEDTNAFDLPFDGPATYKAKLVRNGVRIYLYMAKDNGAKDTGEPREIAHTEVSFSGPVLVGLAVCSHQADASDTVVFLDVTVQAQPPAAPKAQ
jgi:TolB protein